MSAQAQEQRPVIRAARAFRLEQEIGALVKRVAEIRKGEDLHDSDRAFIDELLAFEGVHGWRGLSLAQVGRAISIVAHFAQSAERAA